MENTVSKVFDCGYRVLDKIQKTQSVAIAQAGELVAKAHVNGHKFFVSGSGHSHTVAEEFYGRAGGLAFVVPIMTTELTLNEHPTKSSYIERLSGYAEILATLYGIAKDDVVLIASNSGRNAYPIELALAAKERGAKVIAITSVHHSTNTTSRHESGKKLMDIADIVIDNCGEEGDSALSLDGLSTKVCPTSSMANAFIAQGISVSCAQAMLYLGEKPPIFISLNSDGNESVNEVYFKKYTRLY